MMRSVAHTLRAICTRRAIYASSALLALAIAASAGPAASADPKGTLAVVNGIPGQRVDICLNGNEIRSGLGFGAAVLRNVVATGPKTLQIRAASKGKCRGQQLAQRSFALPPGADLTIVATKHAPGKLVLFDNVAPTYLGQIPPAGSPYPEALMVWRYAAELPVEFKYVVYAQSSTINPIDPAGSRAAAIWTKGDQVTSTVVPGAIWDLRATREGSSEPITRRAVLLTGSHRHEWILVGTDPGNLRFVVLDRFVSGP